MTHKENCPVIKRLDNIIVNMTECGETKKAQHLRILKICCGECRCRKGGFIASVDRFIVRQILEVCNIEKDLDNL